MIFAANNHAVDEADKVSLLVVDDDPPIRRLLERVAKRAGFDVDSAKDGVQALEMLARKRYQIAIVDLMMPRLSGYELMQRISSLEPRPHVVVATAMGNTDVPGIDASVIRRVIRKPFDIDALARVLIEMAGEISENRGTVPGLTVAPPEITAVPPEVTIAGPDVATLPVSGPTMEANDRPTATPLEDKATELPPPTDELQGC